VGKQVSVGLHGVSAEEDTRNEYGIPFDVGAHVPDNQGYFNQAVDNSVNKALPWVVLVAVVACSLGGVGLGLGIGARDTANRAEREARLQRLEIDEMKVALKTQGIKVHEGSTP
jgi:hypothetical protein